MKGTDAHMRAETFRAQLVTAREMLAARGVSKGVAEPPLYRLLWLCGVRLPPPAFCSFALNACLLGAYFAVFWAGFMAICVWITENVIPLQLLFMAPIGGVVFGVGTAAYNRSVRSKHELPTWESLARPRDSET